MKIEARALAWILPLGLALAACAAPLPEEEEGPEPPPLAFLLADQNGDRVLTDAEWQRRVDLLFNELDEDDDGYIEVEELKRQFSRLDENKDGRIEPEEAITIVEDGDLNGDGSVSPAEYAAYKWDLAAVDSDGDGRLSRSEFRRAQRQTFADFDRDRDKLLRPYDIDERSRFTILRF